MVARPARRGESRPASGTKAAAHYRLDVPAGGAGRRCGCGCSPTDEAPARAVRPRVRRACSPSAIARPTSSTPRASRPALDRRGAARSRARRYAGLLWSKQFYHYVVKRLARGRSRAAAAAAERASRAATRDWRAPLQPRRHLDARQVGVPVVRGVGPRLPHDPVRAHRPGSSPRSSSCCFLREWYMHPNGQLPAYEFAFGDVNPPVHAWACWRVYKMTGAARRARPRVPRARLPEAAAQLHLVGEPQGRRGQATSSPAASSASTTSACSTARKPLPTGGHLEQADGTAWMAFYCATMLVDGARAGAATTRPTRTWRRKFFEHFVAIADAMNTLGGTGLWDEAGRLLLRPAPRRRHARCRCACARWSG